MCTSLAQVYSVYGEHTARLLSTGKTWKIRIGSCLNKPGIGIGKLPLTQELFLVGVGDWVVRIHDPFKRLKLYRSGDGPMTVTKVISDCWEGCTRPIWPGYDLGGVVTSLTTGMVRGLRRYCQNLRTTYIERTTEMGSWETKESCRPN